MDELLRDFLTETGESLDLVDAELVRFEQEPNNGQILGNIFRLVHTIKGTCGFLALSRLEKLTHAAETVMGKFRDGMPVTAEAVTLILSTIDRIKTILEAIEAKSRSRPVTTPTSSSSSRGWRGKIFRSKIFRSKTMQHRNRLPPKPSKSRSATQTKNPPASPAKSSQAIRSASASIRSITS